MLHKYNLVHLATLSSKNGRRKELNIVQQNGKEVLDIRDWTPDHSDASRGIQLTEAEMDVLTATFEKWFKGGRPTLETPDTFAKGKGRFVRYDIYAYLAKLSEGDGIMPPYELNVVSWDEGPLMVDIHRWATLKNHEHERFGSGVSLSVTEAVTLLHAYREWKAKGVAA